MSRTILLSLAVALVAVAAFIAVAPPGKAPDTGMQHKPVPSGEPAWTHVCLGVVDDPDWC
ncbi:hypothetical protein ACWEDZ_02125 [Streptomyces sp. NPDC005047]